MNCELTIQLMLLELELAVRQQSMGVTWAVVSGASFLGVMVALTVTSIILGGRI